MDASPMAGTIEVVAAPAFHSTASAARGNVRGFLVSAQAVIR